MNRDEALALLIGLIERVMWEGLRITPDEHLAVDILREDLMLEATG